MSYYFDNNNRYQIIYPFTSNKIHVESSIDHGAYRCYQELKEHNVVTYIFIVHDIDAGTLYYFNIPKNKHLETNVQNNGFDQDRETMTRPEIMNNEQNTTKLFTPPCGASVPNHKPFYRMDRSGSQRHEDVNAQNISEPKNQNLNRVQPMQPMQQAINIINPANSMPVNLQNPMVEYNTAKQNEIITRLNHVEYQLEYLKKKVNSVPKKEEDGCVIM